MKKVLIAILFFGLFWSCKKENPPAPETPPAPTPAPAVVDFRDTILGTYAGPYYGSSGNYYYNTSTNFTGNDTIVITADPNDSTRIICTSTAPNTYPYGLVLRPNYNFNGLPQDVHSSDYGHFAFTGTTIFFISDGSYSYGQNWSNRHFTGHKLP